MVTEICTPNGRLGCYNGGTCVVTDGSDDSDDDGNGNGAANGFRCECRDGYEGPYCELGTPEVVLGYRKCREMGRLKEYELAGTEVRSMRKVLA